MNETDAFFTHTIVGAPLSVSLGRRPSTRHQTTQQGLRIGWRDGKTYLSSAWRDWVVTSHACDPVGQPRLRPSRWRRQLERHALLIAIAGLLTLICSVFFWGGVVWS